MRFNSAVLIGVVLAASAPAQFLPDIRVSPTRIRVGSGDTTITVSGTNFKPNFQVYWNGAPSSTQFVSAWTLKALIPSAGLQQPGLAQISVYDPDAGAAVSNPSPLLIYLPLHTSDLVYDPVRARMYAGVTKDDVNGPSVGIIDPARGIVERYIPLPGDPTTLAVSAGSQYLYIGMNDRVRRTDLTGAGQDADLIFNTLPPNGSTSPASSILPLPGDGTSYVVALGFGIGSAFAVDGVTPRPNHSNDAPQCLVAQVGGTSLYGGPGFRLLKLDAMGFPYIAALSVPSLAAGPFCPAFGNGLLYGSNGDIVDPVGPSRIGRLGGWGMVDAAPERNRIYFFGFAGAPAIAGNTPIPSVMAFDSSTYALVESLPLPVNLQSYHGRMIHWGPDGVAFGDYPANTIASDGLYLVHVPAGN